MFSKPITAIIGPNGVGKSNIADAFRWVLGEQSLKQVRTKESTDVIFAGSEHAGKVSLAQVAVKFDMSDSIGKNEAAEGDASPFANLSEIEIIRKIYADGESAYLLNGSPVRLFDIQFLLAEHNVGQKNYAIIGQGMIDEVLRLSPADRMDFFYEATGVKKYQIKLHKASLKLETSQEHLGQTQALLKEITPHKKYLERQVEKYTRKETVLELLQKKQLHYYSASFWQIESALKDKRYDFQQIEKQHRAHSNEVETLQRQIRQFKNTEHRVEDYQRFEELAHAYTSKRDQLRSKIAQLDHERGFRLEQEGGVDVAFLNRRFIEIEELIQEAQGGKRTLANHQEDITAILSSKQQELQEAFHRVEQIKNTHTFTPETVLVRLEGLLIVDEARELKVRIAELIEEIKQISGVGMLAELEQVLSELRAETEELRIKKEVLQEKLSMVEEHSKRCAAEREDIRLKLKKYMEGGDDVWFKEVLKRKESYAEELALIEEKLQETQRASGLWRREEEAKREKVYAWQKQYQEALEQKQHIEGLVQAVKIELTRLEMQREQIVAEMKEEMGDTKTDSIVEQKQEVVYDKNIKGLKTEIKALKQEAAELGEIEEGVVDEYRAVKARHDFLSEQTADLESAIASLKKISTRLKQTITTQFSERFVELARVFKQYFKILFDGGEAEIVEITLEEGGYGIDITAHPPGKKIKHINALSGGERSMVAVALICAIVASNPPPFVILDEIDAALDEANSERLAGILQKLSKNTQLITITHNRATMEIADVLHGVTMGDDGVSRLVSVRLEDYVHA